MTFRRNPGRFVHKIILLKPGALARDELGGIEPTTYTNACTLFAALSDKNQTRQQVIGDYVTVDTKYFVVRDITSMVPGLDTSWRLTYNGFTYLINKVDLINESRPFYIQITATAANAGGVVR